MRAARILLVEDDAVISKGLDFQLRRQGYEVACVEEASQAKKYVRVIRPDLIILDVGLPTRDPNDPKWDGLDLLEWLRWMGIHVPVIIHSSMNPALIKERNLEPQPVAYLRKPVRMPDFLATVHAAMPVNVPDEDPGPSAAQPVTAGTNQGAAAA